MSTGIRIEIQCRLEVWYVTFTIWIYLPLFTQAGGMRLGQKCIVFPEGINPSISQTREIHHSLHVSFIPTLQHHDEISNDHITSNKERNHVED
jgi:hypothetical protein